jgi:hypothetical protein
VTGGRIPLDEAMRLFFAHAFSRMPPELGTELQRKLLEQSRPKEPGLMWWADHALMVFEEDGGLVVERAEVDQIIGKVKPYELPSA